mmetsp:Transcript_17488/g.52573  ORF Transcript_17488/g.52573 Transcript_17488/m.52573 type:complete len:292 (-) Transcript_17488:88-963(-)
MKSKRDREEPCLICNHYHDYEGGEACSVCGHVMTVAEVKPTDTVLPTAVIPGFLYLGSYDTASRSEILKAMAITHILNTVPTCQPLFKNTFQYRTVSSSPPDFKECFDFIDSVKAEGSSKVLVHCMSGLSRSPTVVIAYLMKARGWRLLESYKWVQEKRPLLQLSPGDKLRLVEFEMSMYNSCSVSAGFGGVGGTGAQRQGTFASMPAGGSDGSAPASTSACADVGMPAFSVPAGQPTWMLSGVGGGSGQPLAAQQPSAVAPASVGFGGGFVFGATEPSAPTCGNDSEMET